MGSRPGFPLPYAQLVFLVFSLDESLLPPLGDRWARDVCIDFSLVSDFFPSTRQLHRPWFLLQ